MHIRRYHPGEEVELWELFSDTVRNINIQDYSIDQVRAWAPDEMDREKWFSRIEQMNPFVCVSDGDIAGYASLLETGYVDHFYVHHHWQRKGVGRALMKKIFETAEKLGLGELTSDVSITAKPFFESHGFIVVMPQEVTVRGVVFRNFKMHNSLK